MENTYLFGLHFTALPLWQGVSQYVGRHSTRDFWITSDSAGIISQPYWDSTYYKDILYDAPDYNFITTPPGLSTVANIRNNKYTRFILKCIETASLLESELEILEIGAGNLNTAKCLQNSLNIKKYTIVDPAIKESDESITVIPKYYDQHCKLDGLFDVIISINCLEHVQDPILFLKKIKANLKKNNGIAILFFPDSEKQFKVGDINAIVHEHLSYFSADSFSQACHAAELRIQYIESDQDQFRCVLESVDNVLECSASDVNASYDLIKEFTLQFEKNFSAFKKIIYDLHHRNESIVFHGATNGLNTLFYFLKNTSITVPLNKIILVDGDETKTGKYLPSLDVPIRLPESSLCHKENRIIISAPSFFDEIVNFYVSENLIKGKNPINILELSHATL